MFSRLSYWLLPPGIQNLLRDGRAKWRCLRAPNHVLRLNERFRNCHQDRSRCFILATGPSINTQDVKLLRGETCISLSNFFVHPDNGLIRPAYHCVPKLSFPPSTCETAARWFQEMEAKTGQATFFFDNGDRSLIERNGLFRGKNVHYLVFGRSWERVESRGIDLTRPLPRIQSSPVMAIQIAIFMGFKEIHLLGCDHDWLLHIGESRHFYQEKEHAIFQRPGAREVWNLEEDARSIAVLWGQYQALLKYASQRGIRICNATAGGLLEVFPRVRYASLFEKGTSGGATTPGA